VGGTIRLLLRAGVPLGPVMLLNVRGRTSGLPRTNSVDVFERNGRRWLVATHHGEAQWVRNLRVAGEGTLTRGRRRLAFTTVELSPEDAGTVLRDVLAPRLGRPLGGLVLRQTLNVPADATPAAFAAAAEHHPVFELTVRGRTEVVGTRNRRHPSGVPLAVIGVGVLTVLIHLALAVTTAMATPQWVSGIVIGLLVAGLGNHLRLFRHG
jgi:deazaflavin-dependent oxidoreductase (nitroreductase family)